MSIHDEQLNKDIQGVIDGYRESIKGINISTPKPVFAAKSVVKKHHLDNTAVHSALNQLKGARNRTQRMADWIAKINTDSSKRVFLLKKIRNESKSLFSDVRTCLKNISG